MGQIIQAKVEEKEWMKRSYVEYLNETTDNEDIKNFFFLNGANFIRLRYLGDNVMLLTPEGETSVEDMIKENKEWLEEFFDDIRPWDNSVTVGKRRVWVRVWGIPFHLWEWSVFVSTVINIRNLLAVDEITENHDELQYARLLVSIPFVAKARSSKRMMINGTIYQICIEEDLICCDNLKQTNKDEVSWSESFVGKDEDVSDYDNAKELEKSMSASSKLVPEMNPEISLEMTPEGRYDSPTMREPLKSYSSDTVVPDSASQDSGYKSPTDMIHVSPRVAQPNGPNKTQAQRWECAKP
ncbi:hypothetical protein VNO80_01727 [Phaseolus coccineus]|uniref:DUF4283 domain-containing protein n=1 Tax=Phaseolus coccineus TaxID=3886 RepID=A0AAN9RT35_PHACN